MQRKAPNDNSCRSVKRLYGGESKVEATTGVQKRTGMELQLIYL